MKRCLFALAVLTATALCCQSTARSQAQTGDFRAELSGHKRSLTVAFSRSAPFQVNASRVRLKLAPHDGKGASYVLAPNVAGTMPSIAAKNVAVVDLQFAIPDDAGPALYDAKIQAPEAPIDPPYVYIPSLRNDTGLQEAKTRFEGRDVQSYGGVTLQCLPPPYGAIEVSLVTIPSQSVKIASISRGANASVFSFGGTLERGGGGGPSYLAVDPLVVELEANLNDVIAAGFVAGGSMAGDRLLDALRNDPSQCHQLEATFSDAWELERFVSTELAGERAAWPPAMQAAVARQEVLPGMTYEMIAAMWGFPDGYGTAAQMEKLAVWHYVGGPATARTVHFANGVVSTWREDPKT